MTLTSGRRWTFAILAATLSFVGTIAGLLALDVYVHHRLAPYLGVNIWGYRGPVLPRKQWDEYRIVVLGASTAFGWGTPPEAAIPAVAERRLRTQVSRPLTVINLGFPAENAYAFRADLEDYAFLKPDLVVLYGQRNRLATPHEILRENSLVYRLTGYYPMLPVYFREKAMALRFGGNLDAAYRKQAASSPSWTVRLAATALDGAWRTTESLGAAFDHVGRRPDEPRVEVPTCDAEWKEYCDAVYRAVTHARARQLPVLLVAQPEAATEEQQRALQAMLRMYFATDRAVRYLDLQKAVDVHDWSLAYDGLHLSVEGNRIIGERIVEDLLSWPEFQRTASAPAIRP
jgi:hypothetical protein